MQNSYKSDGRKGLFWATVSSMSTVSVVGNGIKSTISMDREKLAAQFEDHDSSSEFAKEVISDKKEIWGVVETTQYTVRMDSIDSTGTNEDIVVPTTTKKLPPKNMLLASLWNTLKIAETSFISSIVFHTQLQTTEMTPPSKYSGTLDSSLAKEEELQRQTGCKVEHLPTRGLSIGDCEDRRLYTLSWATLLS